MCLCIKIISKEILTSRLEVEQHPRGLVGLDASGQGLVVLSAWLPAVKGGCRRLKRGVTRRPAVALRRHVAA